MACSAEFPEAQKGIDFAASAVPTDNQLKIGNGVSYCFGEPLHSTSRRPSNNSAQSPTWMEPSQTLQHVGCSIIARFGADVNQLVHRDCPPGYWKAANASRRLSRTP